MSTDAMKYPLSDLYSIAGRAANTFLRLGSLVTKMVFTLYMGRYLGLNEMGTYGLVAAYVAIAVTLLGVRFDYVVSRDIVDASDFNIARKIRDQVVFYGLNYLFLAAVIGLAMTGPLKNISREIIIFTIVISILESLTAITSGNIVSLKKPVLANVLFFIRAALWTLPAMAQGLLFPSMRTAEMIFYWWAAGNIMSFIVTCYVWRRFPWMQVMKTPVDWTWIKTGVKKCTFIWLGAIGAAAATYVDRFVVEHYLSLDFVGIVSFYGSFVLAIQSLLHSSVFSFSYPRLISHYRQRDEVQFRQEVWRMTFQATAFSGFIALAVGVAVPVLGTFFHRPEYLEYSGTLWLILLGVWLRSTTEGLYYVLYARHQDRLIWVGGLLFLIPAFGCNMILVPLLGFVGIGYSAIVAAIFLSLWRIYCVTYCVSYNSAQGDPELIKIEAGVQDENF